MQDNGATRIGAETAPTAAWEGQSLVYEVTGEQMLAEPAMREEVFGPFILLVRLTGLDRLREVARAFRSQLSASVHAEASDHATAVELLPILERRTGRIVINNFSMPVCHEREGGARM
ncbi:hypothetical protein [Streptomyces sp. NPDC002573]|uniref:hypothetical protein n=1 Tax=Streptomyces sp. NPDC002573 TaxID=3364651 RepID=UPI0036B3AA0B